MIHFLHIGKTGGTAVKHALAQMSESARSRLKIHGHDKTFMEIVCGQRIIFFLRDPISRFISAFYSRRRQGRPKYDSPWSEAERAAFERFATPNELGMALSSGDDGERNAAVAAMQSIYHIKSPYADWLGDEQYFLSRIGDVFFIGFQETLDNDFRALKDKLSLAELISLPSDDLQAHKNPPGLDRSLSELAQESLQKWYAQDFACVELCRQLAPRVNASTVCTFSS
jgi:Sulfotransferase family